MQSACNKPRSPRDPRSHQGTLRPARTPRNQGVSHSFQAGHACAISAGSCSGEGHRRCGGGRPRVCRGLRCGPRRGWACPGGWARAGIPVSHPTDGRLERVRRSGAAPCDRPELSGPFENLGPAERCECASHSGRTERDGRPGSGRSVGWSLSGDSLKRARRHRRRGAVPGSMQARVVGHLRLCVGRGRTGLRFRFGSRQVRFDLGLDQRDHPGGADVRVDEDGSE